MGILEKENIFICRNYTVEPLFKDFTGINYSGYEDISSVPDNASIYLWFYLCPVNEGEQEMMEKIEDYKHKLDLVLRSCNPSAYVLLFTLTPLSDFSFTTNNSKLFESVNNYNQYLYSKADSRILTKVIQFEDFVRNVKFKQIIDWRYYFLYRTLINPGLANSFRQWFSRQWSSIEGKRKKCLVLDLDNTIWGGILGEDGIEGIQLGNNYPGNAFKSFQRLLHEAAKCGVLLAVISKNNEDDVWEAIDRHPDMELRKSDFVAWRINWKDKSSNLSEIAEELNIGTDSIVFIDDNPVERNWIITSKPEVVVPDFPRQPYQLISFFHEIYNSWFQTYDLTREDQNKLDQYRQNSLRKHSQQGFQNLKDYIASLNISICIKEADSFTIQRIAQLTQKTNQFNLTTKRYAENDISNFMSQGHKVYSVSVTDKFGDNGITAVCIMTTLSNSQAEIDTLLLSCRILGRSIEFALVKKLLNMAFENGINEVFAFYLPTAKNIQTADFYDRLGFQILESNHHKKYRLYIDRLFEIEPYYRFEIL